MDVRIGFEECGGSLNSPFRAESFWIDGCSIIEGV
jgi:hypothetical protein